ncbi:hypothetical protein JCM19297_192 [Nonlabens ulvanivorans]|nr:hypothetical protein JCM19297_192 [Nonlabens ulvanivorans]
MRTAKIVFLLIPTYFFLGARNIFMRFPSSLGICSTLPSSSRSRASLNNRISP